MNGALSIALLSLFSAAAWACGPSQSVSTSKPVVRSIPHTEYPKEPPAVADSLPTYPAPPSDDPDADPAAPRDVAAVPDTATITASGLAFRVLRAGDSSGIRPGPDDRVTVHYSGWTSDGKRFDSSVVRGRPATFKLGSLIEGWTQGLQLMEVGEKTRFWIPESLGYKGRPGAPSGLTVYDIELIKVIAVAPSKVRGFSPL